MKDSIKKWINPFLRSRVFLLSMIIAQGFLFQASAEVKLASIFRDHMVLQREIEIPVWGWADKGEKITATFCGLTVSVKADKRGMFMVKFLPMDAGGPYEMTIQGKNKIVLSDVLIGDVWICGGQSNMEMPIKGFTGQPITNSDRELKNANFNSIRLITVERNMSTVPVDGFTSSGWGSAIGENIGDFSAVGYFFGKEIFLDQNVPIGLISVNWGGTVCETWTSAESLEDDPDFGPIVQEMKENPPSDLTNPNSKPTLLYNGMLHPIIPYGIKGAIWYQGEANASRAYQYRRLFPQMIQDWRDHWGQGNFPFLFVQLAAYYPVDDQPVESAWAELREAQSKSLNAVLNTGMAVTIDIGEANCIHPANKEDVGKRLALVALKTAYNKEIVYSGPVYQTKEIAGNEIRLNFTQTGSGLIAKDKYGYLKGFAIAGSDRKFHWAKARIEGISVIVHCPSVSDPVAVRYAWSNNPDDANLINKEGLPASPFRTDDWPGITKGKK